MVWVQVIRSNPSGCFFLLTSMSGYWKGHSQSQSQGDTLAREPPQQQRQESIGTQIRPVKDQRAAFKPSHPLFFDDDSDILKSPKDEDQDERILDDNIASTSTHKNQTPAAMNSKSSKPIPRKRVTKKAPVIVDDDSDDGATFKGFRIKNRPLR